MGLETCKLQTKDLTEHGKKAGTVPNHLMLFLAEVFGEVSNTKLRIDWND